MKTEVLKYLMDHYGVTENKGIELIARNQDKIADAEKWASAPYWAADRIAEAEALLHLERCPGCEAEELAESPE